jgi:hypothetical protein
MKTLKFNVIITGIRSKVDRSLGLTIGTPELSSAEKAEIMNLQGINLDMILTPLDETPDEVITIKKDIESKSQSQRIRNILFLLWKQEGEPDTFDIFYYHKTEKYIEMLKSKLEE